MKTNWIKPKVVTGPIAKGNNYYHRAEIEKKIIELLENENYVLLSAPRRVGKSSLLIYIAENPNDNYQIKFRNIQGVKSETEFYKIIYELIFDCLKSNQKGKQWIENFLKQRRISEIDIKGKIKIDNKTFEYLDELNHLLEKIPANEKTIVLLIDELPEVLHTLNNSGKKDQAISIIKNLRQWRQDKFSEKIKYVLSGSIGIHYVVNNIIGRSSDLNDIKKINVEPFDQQEAIKYIKWATKGATVAYSQTLEKYLLEKIIYYVPYFINIMLVAIDEQAHKKNNPKITKEVITVAFEKIVKDNDYFKDWKQRLNDYMPLQDFTFINEVLTHISHKNYATIQEIYDKAIKHDKTLTYMELISDLEKDGYIVEQGDKYVFISPFLKTFWKRNNPIYNE
jgi:uncharacterized protein